jgi:hypothetical protein
MRRSIFQLLAFLFVFGFQAASQTTFQYQEVNVAGPGLTRRIHSVMVPVAPKTTNGTSRFERHPPARFVVNDAADGRDLNLSDTICADTNGRCSLRAAIEQANAIGSGVITFAFDAPTRINIDGEPLVLDASRANIELVGPGAHILTLGRDRRSKEGGTVFIIASHGGRVAVSGVTVSDGSPGPASPGSCFLVSNESELLLDNVVVEQCSADAGGGIASWGTLRIADSTIRNNAARLGGGILTAGSMTMRSSAVYSNKAEQGSGINNNDDFHTATIINSTITNNYARGGINTGAYGGGIFNFGPMDMSNVTVADNSSAEAGAGFADFASIWAPELSQIRNTLIAQNVSPSLPDLFTWGLISHGHNLISRGYLPDPLPTDLQGTVGQPIDALLGPLANNGGPTLTMALLPGSPAIDRGGSSTLAATDQRGFARISDIPSIPNTGDGSDIGAFEVQIATARVSVRALGPWNDPIRVGTAVLIDEVSGDQRVAVATMLGYFRWSNVPTGRDYRIVVKHKRYTFAPLIINVNGDITDLVMTGTF